jgi:hypothetical protein
MPHFKFLPCAAIKVNPQLMSNTLNSVSNRDIHGFVPHPFQASLKRYFCFFVCYLELIPVYGYNLPDFILTDHKESP